MLTVSNSVQKTSKFGLARLDGTQALGLMAAAAKAKPVWFDLLLCYRRGLLWSLKVVCTPYASHSVAHQLI